MKLSRLNMNFHMYIKYLDSLPKSPWAFFSFSYLFYYKMQIMLKNNNKAATQKQIKDGEEAEKETMGLIDIGIPQSEK